MTYGPPPKTCVACGITRIPPEAVDDTFRCVDRDGCRERVIALTKDVRSDIAARVIAALF